MKPILMFIIESCPYCRQALKWMKEIKGEDPKYSQIDIAIIDETVQPDLANKYDYYLVPTYYVNGVKIHEGAATKKIVHNVFERALE